MCCPVDKEAKLQLPKDSELQGGGTGVKCRVTGKLLHALSWVTLGSVWLFAGEADAYFR